MPGFDPPLFRTVVEVPPPALPQGTQIRLVTDADLAPFSFLSASGSPAGLAVELTLAACAEIAVECIITPRPFAELLPALAGGEADGVIAGPKLDPQTAAAALPTRPYFRVMGRFAVQMQNPLAAADAQSLRGKKIGVLRDTLHARWLDAYYSDSVITPFASWAEAGDALRTGSIDALFGDNLRLLYWLAGEKAGKCCRPLGGAFSDFDYFSRHMVLLVARAKPDLRAAFDYGFDMAQKNGASSRIIKAYLPLPPW